MVDINIVQRSSIVLVNADIKAHSDLVKNRSKHTDVKFHFIRCEFRAESIELVYFPTDENIADIYTKPT